MRRRKTAPDSKVQQKQGIGRTKGRHLRRPGERILSAAGRLFRQKGYLETNMQDIANAANVHKSTIYSYYKSKGYLLYESAERNIQAHLDLAMPIMNSNLPPEDKLQQLVANHIRWRAKNIGLLAGVGDTERRYLPPKLLQAHIEKREGYEAFFRKIVEEILDKRNNRHISPELASNFVLGLAHSINRWYKANGELSIEEIISSANEFIFKALELDNSEADSSMPESRKKPL